jgi:hypothetical protein
VKGQKEGTGWRREEDGAVGMMSESGKAGRLWLRKWLASISLQKCGKDRSRCDPGQEGRMDTCHWFIQQHL